MTSRRMARTCRPALALLTGLILAASTAPVLAQIENKFRPAQPTTKELLRKAYEAANKESFDEAISLMDQALKQAPDDRQALMLATIVASMAADKATTPARQVTLLRRATDSYTRLRDRYQPLARNEAGLSELVGLNDARILALEGKPEPALNALVRRISQGYENFDAIEQISDLKTVRSLPDYQAKLAQASQAGIKAAIAATKPFPFDFNLKDVDGKEVKLGDFKGKVTIVDIWGTWCPPCRQEIPHFVALLAKHEAEGLKVVGINCNEQGSPDEVKQTINDFKAENKVAYPCLLNDETTEGKVPGFQGYPTTLFLDRTGKVRLVLVGYSPLIRLEAVVATLLAEPPS